MFCNLTFWSYKLEICFTISLLPFCGRLKDNGFSCHLSSWPSEVEMCFMIYLCWEKQWILLSPPCLVFCFKISHCWCGVEFKIKGGFYCFEFVFQDIHLLARVFKTRKGFLLSCFVFQYISLSVWCGVAFKTRGGFLLSLPAT